METTRLKDATFPTETAAGDLGGVQPNETEQQLRRRLIQLMSELSMQLGHACLMDLADYVVAVSACSRAALVE